MDKPIAPSAAMRGSSFWLWPPAGSPITARNGLAVRIFDDATRVVVFLGYRTTDKHGQTVPSFGGTGFFVDHEGFSYLVTARHVAKGIHPPFVIGYNNSNGEMELDDVDYAEWHYHEDPTVDVAVIPGALTKADWKIFPSSLFRVEHPGRKPLLGRGTWFI